MKKALLILAILLIAVPAHGAGFWGGGGSSSATTSAAGIVELATDAETAAGSATDKVLTPSNLTGMGLLPLGTAGQVLRVNSGATALEYGTVSSTVPIGHLSGLTVSRKDNDEVYVSGGAVEIGEVLYNSDAQLAVAPGGEPLGYSEDLCVGGTATESYTYNEYWHADRVFDSNVDGTGWTTGGACENYWLQYQTASSETPIRLTLRANNREATYTLKASATGVFGGEEVTLWTDTQKLNNTSDHVFTFSNTSAYTYFRLYVTAAGELVIYNMELMEAAYILAASTPYYVYVDPPSSGTELAAENLIISATAPSFDSAKGGYYHPTNTDQRAIAHFTTDASGYVPTSPFVHYQPVPQVSSGAQLLSITNLPLNADGETTIYTVPAGVRCVLSYAILVAGADAASTDLTIGADGTETDWLGTQQLDNLDAQYDAVMLMPISNATPVKIKSYAATTVIKAAVANHAGGATNTLYLYGMLY